MSLTVIILAAGQGKRMRSGLPKVLHELAGRPMLAHVLETAAALRARDVRVVFGHGGERVRESFSAAEVSWIRQARQQGTGHAVKQALPGINPRDTVLVLYGDVPLVQAGTLRGLTRRAARGQLAILTAELDDPTGYGRIIRGGRGRVAAIVEEKDASRAQRELREINTGLMACPAGLLAKWVRRLRANNAQREYYLTDIIAMAAKEGVGIAAVRAASAEEVLGINDKSQLADAERVLRQRAAAALMAQGVTLIDPERLDVRGVVRCGRDVVIDANVLLEGTVRIGDGVRVGPFTHIRDSEIGADTRIHSHCVMDGANVGRSCEIGPYARLRPGVEMAGDGKVGNFVEVKKSSIGRGSKVNHLTYVGDATIGDRVNVGAGTITCNYDGAHKHRTVIGDDVFIGSGVELVAPVEIRDGATIGAGSTITKDAPARQLTLARARQATISHWKRPTKATKTGS